MSWIVMIAFGAVIGQFAAHVHRSQLPKLRPDQMRRRATDQARNGTDPRIRLPVFGDEDTGRHDL